MKRKPSRQLHLPFTTSLRDASCRHETRFVTHSVVPAGLMCFRCGKLMYQYLPQSPEQLGYLSAEWAWHYRDGKPWTTL